jgi:hypothetical protein
MMMKRMPEKSMKGITVIGKAEEDIDDNEGQTRP